MTIQEAVETYNKLISEIDSARKMIDLLHPRSKEDVIAIGRENAECISNHLRNRIHDLMSELHREFNLNVGDTDGDSGEL